jgi:hypothetical protein
MDESDTNVAQNCWEFMECPIKTREQCLGYSLNMGKGCWFICQVNKGSIAGRIGDGCFNCPWFKKNNPDLVKTML